MEFKELKTKNEGDLQKILRAQREKLRDLRFKVANKQLKNIREIRTIKTIISRTLTVINSKKKEAAAKAEKPQTVEAAKVEEKSEGATVEENKEETK